MVTGDCVEVECPCGADHGIDSPAAYLLVAKSVYELGETVNVTVDGLGAWRVPRIWIGIHGLKAVELPALAERYGWERVA